MHWDEVADRCFRRRYEPFDVTVGVVLGDRGAVLIDTRASLAQGRALRADLAALGVTEPYAVINTHGHFDHCFGNAAFDPPHGRWGHPSLPGYLAGPAHEAMAEEFPELAGAADGEPIAAPDQAVAASAELDLGDRTVALHHPGPGHTAGDLVVWVPDAGCLFAGDLVEESGPPAYGPDSFPLEWAAALGRLARLYGGRPDTVVVPGHGEPVDPAFVEAQRGRIARVAELIHAAHAAGLDPGSALEPNRPYDWPFPPESLRPAVRRGFARLDVSLPGSPSGAD